jgi:pimeloyl-ACP methyl ester carboxylesterase
VAFAKSFSLLRDNRVFQNLDKIQQPVLILWGEKDKIIPFKFAKKISTRIKNMIFYSHPQAGHHPHEDEPLWTAEKISQFLTEK